MSLNYSEPSTPAEVEQALAANPSITPATQLAITQTLGLGSGSPVIVGSVGPDGSIQQPEIPGSTPQMLTFDIGETGEPYTPPPNVVQAMGEAQVLIFNTDRDVVFEINSPRASAADPEPSAPTPRQQAFTAEDIALGARNVSDKFVAAGQDFDRVVQLGNGNDDVKVLDGGSVRITGSAGNDRLEVGRGSDFVSGGEGDDAVVMGSGRDTAVVGWDVDKVDGGADWDVVVFSRAGSDEANPRGTGATDPGRPGVGDWSVSKSGDKLVITSTTSAENAAELNNVSFVQFGDFGENSQVSVAVVNNDLDANVARLYQAVMGRSADEGGLQFWFDKANSGVSLEAITDAFLSFTQSNLLDDAAFIARTYENAFGRAPDEGGFTFWMEKLASGQVTRAQFVDVVVTTDEASTTISNVQVFTDWV